MDAMADDLLADGDMARAVQRLFRWGTQDREGRRIDGLRDLMERLRQQRKDQLERHNMDSLMQDLQERLEKIEQTEREGIDKRVQAGRERAEQDPDAANLQQMLEKMADQKREFLDRLPESPAGSIRELQDYDFMDPDARQQFQELLNMLQQQMLQQQLQGMQQSLQSMTPEQMQNLRSMMRDLNEMLREKLDGGEPDFQSFQEKWGDAFPNVNSLDELIDEMQRRNAQLQSLLQSMSPEQRRELEDMMQSLMKDPGLQQEMAELAMNLEMLSPQRQSQGYPFTGDDPVTLEEAMQLMKQLQEMDELERELRRAEESAKIDQLDPEKVEELLGEEAAETLRQLQQITKVLQEAGYLEQQGDELTLTPRAIRRIGQKALKDIFATLRHNRFGDHETDSGGAGTDRVDETKLYEFGDPFLVDIRRTLMNAVQHNGPTVPQRLDPSDFEVYRTEHLTECSTVLMVDMSRSMILRGCFLAAKKVALALNSLIKGQYPRDNLYIIGFSLFAKELKAESLPTLTWNEWVYGTNMQHGFMLARQLLSRHKGGNRQVIMITDGEPTAHFEPGQTYPEFSYPPTYRTIQETLREVARCTRDKVTINTFMLERSHMLMSFVEQMTQINQGRAFYAAPERLGEYILVDYVKQKRKVVA
jgi:uncharacterized protein with von Willebrand factor type A (vWA) domain